MLATCLYLGVYQSLGTLRYGYVQSHHEEIPSRHLSRPNPDQQKSFRKVHSGQSQWSDDLMFCFTTSDVERTMA